MERYDIGEALASGRDVADLRHSFQGNRKALQILSELHTLKAKGGLFLAPGPRMICTSVENAVIAEELWRGLPFEILSLRYGVGRVRSMLGTMSRHGKHWGAGASSKEEKKAEPGKEDSRSRLKDPAIDAATRQQAERLAELLRQQGMDISPDALFDGIYLLMGGVEKAFDSLPPTTLEFAQFHIIYDRTKPQPVLVDYQVKAAFGGAKTRASLLPQTP